MDDRARSGRVMPSPTVHHNEKPAAATIRDRLNFVFSTTRTHLGKDIRYACVQESAAPLKPR
jgi:hypothetical protein